MESSLHQEANVKFRLISLLTLALALPVVSGDESIQKLILLDRGGKRGLVTFDHKEHETKVNPDPQARLKAKEGGACAGCHHTRDEVGAPQLVKCKSCHVQEGDVANPKNQDGKELFVEEAYHDLCITCHRTAAKAPVLCTGCHKLGRSQ